ncbi:MAG: PHA/PHB synthase family protein [Rhodospirillales bacterium]
MSTAEQPARETRSDSTLAVTEAQLREAQETWKGFMERSQKVMEAFLERQSSGGQVQIPDNQVIAKAFTDWATQWWSNPTAALEAQTKLMQDQLSLWANTVKRLQGEETEPLARPQAGDKRFKDEAWDQEVVFDHIKQSYLLSANWLTDTVRDTEGLEPQTKRKVEFYTRQWVDALSPTNFALTNPAVLKTAVETKGENLMKGLDNLLTDLEQGQGQLRISMTDETAFELGKNIATTPGQVVFQNDMMQLIQYTPTTEEVKKRPLLFVPPWINKFYILDLQAKNSIIKWAVDQGRTVFVISWVNPGADLAHKGFEDYMLEGPVAALDAIWKQTAEGEVDIAAYCIGGTLTACTLAWLAARGEGDRVASATFFTTMTDFSDPGELQVFIDDEQIGLIEKHMEKTGYLDGSQMATVFSMMRANDLIWSFVVNNYLMGRSPLPFDLLYWNGDSTRMPRMMHSFYLRRMYERNDLIKPGAIELAGTPIDLSKIKTPCYLLSTREDHIAPWTSTYAATQIYSGPVTFVLAGSGHIAGVINPPSKVKYGYWTNSKKPKDPEAWLQGATEHEGSWWPHWDAWLTKLKGGKEMVPARDPEKGPLAAIEPAPGSFVKVRAGGASS